MGIAEETKAYVRGSFRKDYDQDAANAMIKLVSLVDDLTSKNREQMDDLISENKELKRQQDRILFRVAYIACRQLLERVAEAVKSAHKTGKRHVNCKGVSLGTQTEALGHLANCTALEQELQTLLKKPTNKDMRDRTAQDLYSQTSDLLHNAMFTDERTLLIPSAFFPAEISLMVTLAANYHLKVKIVNSDGLDLTEVVLSEEQKKLLNGTL